MSAIIFMFICFTFICATCSKLLLAKFMLDKPQAQIIIFVIIGNSHVCICSCSIGVVVKDTFT